MSMKRERSTQQNEALRKQQENIEMEIDSRAIYLGGVFEAGGSMHFIINKFQQEGRSYIYAHPQISFGDNNEERLRRFQSKFGGVVHNHSDKDSWQWTLARDKAIFLANAVQKYTPSHKEFIAATQTWNAYSSEEKLATAEESKREPHVRRRDVVQDPSTYIFLAKEPKFVAGVIDSRGSMFSNTINVISFNLALLKALKDAHGGAVNLKTNQWIIHSDDARKLYDFVKSELLLRAEMAASFFG